MSDSAQTQPAKNPTVVGAQLSVMMFLQFFVWGAWYVSMGTYLEANESLKSAGANAYSLIPVAAILSPFFLGVVADRFFASEKVLGLLHILGGGAMLLVPTVVGDNPNLFLAIVGIHALCYVPTLGLTNTIAFTNVTNGEKQFPLIRVFGTIGWIVAGIIVSSVLQADRSATQFYVAGGAGILLGLYSFMLPHTPPPSKGQPASPGDILGLKALQLLGQRSFAVFVVSSFLICIPLAAYYQLGARYVGATGFENIATTMSAGQFSEIFFMLVMPLFFVRLGVKKMLLIGMIAWVARYGLFAGAWNDKIQWMVLSGVLLHGICYDFFFVTGQIYVDKKAPATIRAQAQGFLVLITQGLGMLVGAQTMGLIEANYTAEAGIRWQDLWIIPCVAAGVIALLFAVLFKDDPKATETETAPGGAAGEPAYSTH